jgi:RHS repeat-associated protein
LEQASAHAFVSLLMTALTSTSSTTIFKYDPFGRRIYKSSSAGTSVYAYDGDNLVEETNSSGAAVARYSQTQNVDEQLAMLRSGATSYYHTDGLGSVTSLSNTAGALAQTYTFDSFGKTTTSTGSLTNPFRYTGREFDVETNLYFYRARYYDPNAGRFTSEDPVKFKAGVNFYRYVKNNAVNLKDPSGLMCFADPPASLGPTICECIWFVGLTRRTTCHYLCVCSDGGPDYFGFYCPATSPDANKLCPAFVIIRTPPARAIWPAPLCR